MKEREDLRKFLRKRKEKTIQQNDTLYKEINSKGLLVSRKIGDSDEVVEKALEKNKVIRKEVKGLKRE